MPCRAAALVAVAVAVGSAAASAYTATSARRPLATAVTAGLDHTCALTRTGSVSCWGYNGHDELGDGRGDGQNSSISVAVQGLSSGVTAVASGGRHTCAVRSGGVLCWGANYSGALGDGTDARRAGPVAVVGLASGIIRTAAGIDHSCALTTAGAVECWGDNHAGEVGDGTTVDKWTPVGVVGLGSGIRAIAADGVHSCALTSGGGVKCWGGGYGVTPVDVPGLTGGTTSLAANCAVTIAGAVKCWSGGPGLHATVVPRLQSGVAAVATSADHACALTSVGGVRCWGENGHGQLGDGTRRDSSIPVDVVGLRRSVSAIAVGFFYTCAVTRAGTLRCWGANSAGQLGDGTTAERRRPSVVVGFGLRASLAIASRSARVGGSGVARIALRCGAPVACRGTLVLVRSAAGARTILGHRRFSLTGGQRRSVPVELTPRAFALVRRLLRVPALARATFRQPEGGTTTVVRRLTLIAPRA